MNSRIRFIVAIVAVMLLGYPVFHRVSAQAPSVTYVQQSATMPNAATKVANCNVAVNNQCTATATPAGSNYVYITGVDLEVCGDATGTVQTNVTWTTTGLTGTPIPWAYSTAINPQVCTYKFVSYSPALKATTPGTAVTVVSPAAATHTAYTGNVFWYEAQ